LLDEVFYGETTMTILLFGSTGQIGSELLKCIANDRIINVPDRSQFDFKNPDTIRTIVQRVKPSVIINAAAFTEVDRAESEPEISQTLNSIAPGVLAEEAGKIGAMMLHYSSDYVYGGNKKTSLTESDLTHPDSVYAQSKLKGEQIISKYCQRHIILRTSWVFSEQRKNFLKTILDLAIKNEELKVITDQVGSPTSAKLVADVTWRVLDLIQNLDKNDSRWGIYNLAASGYDSWHGYAEYIVQQAKELGFPIKCRVITPIVTSEYPLPAKRPNNSKLNTDKLQKTFNIDLPCWKKDVDYVLRSLVNQTNIKLGKSN
jgi:dTDP-4-dehydrorhamnose reductase